MKFCLLINLNICLNLISFSLFYFSILDNEPPLPPKRRNLSQPISKEYEFKPCLKMVKPETDARNKIQGIKVFQPSYTQNKERLEKRHYFEYRKEHINKLQQKELESNTAPVLNEEFRLLNKIGFSKKNLDNLPNNKLLGLNFSKDNKSFNFNESKKSDKKKSSFTPNTNLDHASKNIWMKKEQEQFNNLKIEKENLKKDMDYVKTLDIWEKNVLPKIK